MAGQYPPGSTFKVVTTTALLDAGLDPDETVDCPETIDAGGREFVNFEGSAAGAVPFSTDFAQSCNTAFVSLADRLEPDSLRDAAESYFGFGTDSDLPMEAFSGDVPRGRDETEEAAAMIGQARILASPLTMAGVAATVQAGAWHQPRLIADDETAEAEPLPTDDAETLRALMRLVVTSGTGTALASVFGEPIGKSGTAEYGSGDPPPTHAWFIAARRTSPSPYSSRTGSGRRGRRPDRGRLPDPAGLAILAPAQPVDDRPEPFGPLALVEHHVVGLPGARGPGDEDVEVELQHQFEALDVALAVA